MHTASYIFLAGLAALATAEHGSTHNHQLQERSSFPIPSAVGTITLSEPKVVTGEFDCKLYRYDRGTTCGGQSEGGASDAVFQVKEGGTLKNCIIGAKQSEGVHCLGSCTIKNVWWENVCEDALTIKQTKGTSYIIGGGAKSASDKVIQHNGGGTVSISDFYVTDFGKLYRSCGNCKKQYERHVIIKGVKASSGKTLVGINPNYGDTATIDSATCASSVKTICAEYKGTSNNSEEPKKTSTGVSKYCKYSSPLKSC
ncbi:MAG: hypothetical protein M1834_008654 [Cirrosporium novae-zelandiae]|nr:MAG: hypothetical protein M1834_008654 [Cirrosporium novae-zelandiae]